MAWVTKSSGERVKLPDADVIGDKLTEAEIEAELRALIPPVSRMQFAIALAMNGIVTPEEAKDFAGGTALPAMAKVAIQQSNLSDMEKMAAEIKALGAADIRRMNPLILMLQQAVPMTDEQADALFEAARQID